MYNVKTYIAKERSAESLFMAWILFFGFLYGHQMWSYVFFCWYYCYPFKWQAQARTINIQFNSHSAHCANGKVTIMHTCTCMVYWQPYPFWLFNKLTPHFKWNWIAALVTNYNVERQPCLSPNIQYPFQQRLVFDKGIDFILQYFADGEKKMCTIQSEMHTIYS